MPGKTPSKIGSIQSRCNELKARTKEKATKLKLEQRRNTVGKLSDIAYWPRIEAVAEFRLRWPRIEAVAEFRLRTGRIAWQNTFKDWDSNKGEQLALSDITDWPGIEAVADWPRIEAVAEFTLAKNRSRC
ncbi:unnamed protein product [Rodentolepis nana]|uniref:Uncharacterized protein n=1 Tax=Rodentolepis nana TaxID=102285 RepID=A0A3P7V9C6_RODNA|nr:unnamed protein product [Rodentolepis nana]